MSTRTIMDRFRLPLQLASLLQTVETTKTVEAIEADIGQTLTRLSDDDIVMLTRVAARVFKAIKDEAQRREGVWARCLGAAAEK